MRKRLEKLSISLTTSSPHTLQSKGLAERMNRSLVDKARTVMNHAGLKDEFWTVAIRHAADLHSRTVTPEVKVSTPM